MQQKTLIIVGGSNGSGKTTLAEEIILVDNLKYLGADDIARELNPTNPEQAAIGAARLFSDRLNSALEQSESLIIESTLAGMSLQKWIKKARDFNYSIRIMFVYLDSPELCLKRIAARVERGGHDVPESDVRRRFDRSNNNFWHVYKNLADEWSLFYNTGDNMAQVVAGDGVIEIVLDEARYLQWKKMVKR